MILLAHSVTVLRKSGFVIDGGRCETDAPASAGCPPRQAVRQPLSLIQPGSKPTGAEGSPTRSRRCSLPQPQRDPQQEQPDTARLILLLRASVPPTSARKPECPARGGPTHRLQQMPSLNGYRHRAMNAHGGGPRPDRASPPRRRRSCCGPDPGRAFEGPLAALVSSSTVPELHAHLVSGFSLHCRPPPRRMNCNNLDRPGLSWEE